MTILNISLCLPELDIIALYKKRSIVAVTKRFIVPDRSFALLPCRTDPAADSSYHPQVLNDLKSGLIHSSKQISATHWARCMFCQQVDESAIKTLSDLTIWTENALFSRLQKGSLFLSLLRTHALTEAFVVESDPVCEQLYKFIPLSNYLEVNTDSPIYSSEEFATARQHILEPKPLEIETSESLESIDTASEADPKPDSLLNAPDWIEQISKVGQSSNGYDFEKLVRKGLVLLGFTNSLNQATASLDLNATGGAGGLDFYADWPYPLMGECKATALDTNSVGRPVRQLQNLGTQWLGIEDYNGSVKLVIAAGKIPPHDEQLANSSKTNVIRPKTFQALVALKARYEELFNPSDLEETLRAEPFGKAADEKLSSKIEGWKTIFEDQEVATLEHAKERQRGRQVVQTVKELSEQAIHRGRRGFSVVEVRSHYNAKYQPCLKDEDIENVLSGLTAPFSAGCLGKNQSLDRDRYYFRKDMP